MLERPDLTSRTSKISAPALVSCGEWDLFYPCAVRDGRLIPSAKFVTIREAGHDTVNYQPDEVAADRVGVLQVARGDRLVRRLVGAGESAAGAGEVPEERPQHHAEQGHLQIGEPQQRAQRRPVDVVLARSGDDVRAVHYPQRDGEAANGR